MHAHAPDFSNMKKHELIVYFIIWMQSFELNTPTNFNNL